MQVRFWGTRGSIATPGPGTVRFGGNTACVEVRSDRGTLVVLDCGTGARALGQSLAADAVQRSEPADGAIFIGHTHWDHIQGLPFFAPLFVPGNRWHIYGPRGLGQSLANTLSGQMQYLYFPVTLDQLGAKVHFHDLVEGEFAVGDMSVRTQYLNHPALTLGYRIEVDGVTVVYASDHEPHDATLSAGGDLLASPGDAQHVAFLQGADLVIHDTQYLPNEYEHRVGWGHSTMEYAMDAARLADVGELVLFHHDPMRTDDAVDALLQRAERRAAETGYAGRVSAAAEGAAIAVGRRAGAAKPDGRSHLSATYTPALVELCTTVIIAADDPSLRSAISAAASAEELAVLEVRDLAGLDDGDRAVVVVDHDQNAGVIAALRATAASVTEHVTVLALTRDRPPGNADPLITDWLVWPSTLGHVRTKLRAAVLRRACRWQSAPLPPEEERRLRALHALGILDTEPEERFDRYTKQAAEALDVPIVLVSMVDADRQWFKSRHGFDVQETPRDQSLCAHAILGSDVFQIPDLLEDPRFADSPATNMEGRVRFYAGVPLVVSDGSRVGSLCVVDHRPRTLNDTQLDTLRGLAALVEAELEATRSTT